MKSVLKSLKVSLSSSTGFRFLALNSTESVLISYGMAPASRIASSIWPTRAASVHMQRSCSGRQLALLISLVRVVKSYTIPPSYSNIDVRQWSVFGLSSSLVLVLVFSEVASSIAQRPMREFTESFAKSDPSQAFSMISKGSTKRLAGRCAVAVRVRVMCSQVITPVCSNHSVRTRCCQPGPE